MTFTQKAVEAAAEPSIDERYLHLKENAEAFVQSMKAMVAAAETSGDDDLASKLRTWCLLPWEAALRDDASGELWFLCEACGKPIKDESKQISSKDGCWFHLSCAAANDGEKRR
jgi:hypothetical protein